MKNKKLVLIIGFFVIISGAIVLGLFNRSDDNYKNIAGTWERSDGPYKIEIVEVLEEGKMFAKYYNPNPINVGRAGWRVQNEKLQIYVELQDENYPGSIYQLTFDKDSGTLRGTYYQAVSQQTFEVDFTKKK